MVQRDYELLRILMQKRYDELSRANFSVITFADESYVTAIANHYSAGGAKRFITEFIGAKQIDFPLSKVRKHLSEKFPRANPKRLTLEDIKTLPLFR
jgi:hypothetical protein